MTTATQQLPADPALDFANMVLAETNNALELIDILHDIAQGVDEDATSNDRITATNILLDRGLGKCPRQIAPNAAPNPDPTPETGDKVEPAPYSIRGALREAPSAKPESPRLVTQIKDSLNDSLGPAPSASQHATHTPEPLDSNSIHFTVQQHILAITNNGRTLFDTLAEIARAKDDPRACPEPEPALSLSKGRRAAPRHRARAARILIDRILGTNTTLPQSAPRTGPAKEKPYRRPVRYVDPVKLAKARAEIQRMKDEGILTPDPNRPKIDISSYLPPDDFDLTPYAKEEAAAFWAEVNLRLERQKQWPEIEERRRKKLEQIYPSHSEDDEPPDP